MRYLLDSKAVIALLRRQAGLLNRLQKHPPEAFGVSSIVAHELYYGAFKSRNLAGHLAQIEALQLETLEFDHEDARCAGEVRAKLAALGAPIGPYDVLIAGQALARGLILITHNVREFHRVEGLQSKTGRRLFLRRPAAALLRPA